MFLLFIFSFFVSWIVKVSKKVFESFFFEKKNQLQKLDLNVYFYQTCLVLFFSALCFVTLWYLYEIHTETKTIVEIKEPYVLFLLKRVVFFIASTFLGAYVIVLRLILVFFPMPFDHAILQEECLFEPIRMDGRQPRLGGGPGGLQSDSESDEWGSNGTDISDEDIRNIMGEGNNEGRRRPRPSPSPSPERRRPFRDLRPPVLALEGGPNPPAREAGADLMGNPGGNPPEGAGPAQPNPGGNGGALDAMAIMANIRSTTDMEELSYEQLECVFYSASTREQATNIFFTLDDTCRFEMTVVEDFEVEGFILEKQLMLDFHCLHNPIFREKLHQLDEVANRPYQAHPIGHLLMVKCDISDEAVVERGLVRWSLNNRIHPVFIVRPDVGTEENMAIIGATIRLEATKRFLDRLYYGIPILPMDINNLEGEPIETPRFESTRVKVNDMLRETGVAIPPLPEGGVDFGDRQESNQLILAFFQGLATYLKEQPDPRALMWSAEPLTERRREQMAKAILRFIHLTGTGQNPNPNNFLYTLPEHTQRIINDFVDENL